MAINKMKRIFIAGPEGQEQATLQFLQEAGVVHLEPSGSGMASFDHRYADTMTRVRKLEQLLSSLAAYKTKKHIVAPIRSEDDLVEESEAALNDLRKNKARVNLLEQLCEELEPWGEFEPDQIKELQAAGVFIQRFRTNASVWGDVTLPDNAMIKVIKAKKKNYWFYSLAVNTPITIAGAQELALPAMSLSAAQQELAQLKRSQQQLLDQLTGLAQQADTMKKEMIALLNEAGMYGHLATLCQEPHLFGLQGWLPADQEQPLLKQVNQAGLPLKIVLRPPVENEDPPVQLKNKWLIARIEPLLKLFGIPNYREWDPSYFFAPFMILFFGICLGDAGYGLSFFLISWWLRKKMGNKVPGLADVTKLCQVFALAAMVVGIMTGSFFGYEFKNREWILLDFSISDGDPMILFYISLGLGLIQLSVSYILGALQARTWQAGLQKFGLMLVLWGGVSLIIRNIWFADPSMVSNRLLYGAGISFLSGGAGLILIFSSSSSHWGKRLGSGLWNIYGLTSLVGDLLSYARLFGLGIATTAIAAVMNQLAGMINQAAGSYLGPVLGLVIIIFGHTFNLLLSILGSTVHAARLNFVESFKNFFQGGGKNYQPFKIERG